MRVSIIGVIIVIPTPVREYRISIDVKSHAMKQPTADRIKSNEPVSKSDLELKRTLMMPRSIATNTPTTEDTVRS